MDAPRLDRLTALLRGLRPVVTLTSRANEFSLNIIKTETPDHSSNSQGLMKLNKQIKTIIVVGLVGCFLTSLAGSTAVMLAKGWESQGGLSELLYRLSIGYPAACGVVFCVFPYLVPKVTNFLDEKLK